FDLLLPETPLATPDEKFAEIDGMDKKLVWYADANYYVKYVFREMPDDDITVYARWEDVVPVGFLDKIDRFSASNVTLNSYQDFVDYIDYVCFKNVTGNVQALDWVYLNYDTSDFSSQLDRAVKVDCSYPIMSSLSYIIDGQRLKIALARDITEREASISATGEEDLLPQLGNIFALQSSGRGNTYDKFPIDFVEKTCEVTTSNQLFYVLSRGYRPLPTAGSKAESIYAAFREIMRNICDDGMSDLEKVRAIYEWLILNVQYDYVVIDMEISNAESYLYDAFYLEGVLKGVAVCDGFSKAFCVMCAIERIDCVRVTGESLINGVGHAWNKVQLFGEWFVSDATWGNAKSSGGADEYISYEFLLFTDAGREEFDKQNYTQFEAQTQFDLKSYYSRRDLQVGRYNV
ncbi:MAG: hypothetical protein K2G37_02970, partial [Clostridia bacterium]|nr:hypothetical protein [Clostridia bacterium]